MGISFREDADTLLDLIKCAGELDTAHLFKEWNKYLKNQLDKCSRAPSNCIAKLPEDGAESEAEWIVLIKRVFNNEAAKYIRSSSEHLTSNARNVSANVASAEIYQKTSTI